MAKKEYTVIVTRYKHHASSESRDTEYTGTMDYLVNKVFGYTDTMKLVNVVNAQDKIGQIIDVKITDAKSFSLDGEAI